ncbi:response regulator transcription factor [Parasphingopyxis marina]|uniref:Response regulator n=1 Tax=Parasphingopyxis marina TaxID=2761622 RepID=A0A842I2Q5_9SPHN|nr:response regulator [Parasphingopyxis marina]MBC2778134.1 response regulator [Parasphingopyxis marina]
MAKILVADDDDLLGELVRFKLDQGGHQVETAEDGETALKKAREGGFDLVVLDAMMPVMSGFAVLEALRAEAATSALPIVMLTSRRAQEDVVNALKAGANDYVTKPFIPDELVARVDAILQKTGRKETATPDS